MSRAATKALLALLVTAGCTARFSGSTPRPYKCGSTDAGECPGAWTCNLAALECIDPDAGVPLACASDSDCGGGWRCSPNRLCVDRSVEGMLSTSAAVSEVGAVSPLYPGDGALVTSEPQLVGDPSGSYSLGTDVLFKSSPSQWVWSEDTVTTSGLQSSYLPIPVTSIDQTSIVTTRLLGGHTVHSLWTLVDAGVSVTSGVFDGAADGGLALSTSIIPGPYTGLSVVRSPSSPFAAQSSPLRGAALLIRPERSEAWLGGATEPSFLFPSGAREVASFEYSPTQAATCQSLISVLTGQSLTLQRFDGGAVLFDAGAVVEQRTGFLEDATGARYSLGLLDPVGQLLTIDPCSLATSSPVLACPEGEPLDGWSFVAVGTRLVPQRTCAAGPGQQDIYVEGSDPRAIYDPVVVTAQGTIPWARATGSGALFSSSAGGELVSVSLAVVPDALTTWRGMTLAMHPRAVFALSPVGFLRASSEADPAANFATGDGHFFALRSGVVATTTWTVAFPPTPWEAPRAPVLLRSLALSDGGTLLALSHNDVIDVAQLKTATRTVVELSPTIVPAPGLSVTDFALHLSTDGGFASGYAVASGFLIALSATGPTRWAATRVALPTDVLHVYYDGALPRAVLADGTVLGLTAMVGLTPPTPAPAIAATSSCRAPFVLSDDAVFQLTDAGWRAIPGFGDGGVSFGGGRLLTLEASVFAFDKNGHAWRFEVPCP